MTLNQLRYVIQVAESGSITAAAARLHLAQPSLSKAVTELERELGIVAFERSAHGVTVTAEGDRLLAYARQVVEQANLLESHYVGTAGQRTSLCVSIPHNLHMTEAFARIVTTFEGDRYELTLREVPPAMVIDDVRRMRSELGVIYRSDSRRIALDGAIHEAGLRFEPFATIVPRALVPGDHPLAGREEVAPEELLPYPRVMLEWVSPLRTGIVGPLVGLPASPRVVRTTDRETQRRLVRMLGGYMLFLPLSPGIEAEQSFRALRIAGAGPVEAGVVTLPGFPLSTGADQFRTLLLDLAP